MGTEKKGRLAGKERERLRDLCQLDLLKKMYNYRPEGVHVPGLNLSAQGYWAMTVTQTILPNINLILRLLHEHWDVFTPAEQRLISDYEGNVRSFEEDWKAGNHSPRCIRVPKGMDVMLCRVERNWGSDVPINFLL